jgi:hypothetical protein
MGWKFWQKKEAADGAPKAKKLSKPKELPSAVGRSLVVDRKLDPDWVWSLKCVTAPREEKSIMDFRIFDEGDASARDIWVKNYTTLDDHGDLILFEGWYDKETWKMEIRDARDVRDAAA